MRPAGFAVTGAGRRPAATTSARRQASRLTAADEPLVATPAATAKATTAKRAAPDPARTAGNGEGDPFATLATGEETLDPADTMPFRTFSAVGFLGMGTIFVLTWFLAAAGIVAIWMASVWLRGDSAKGVRDGFNMLFRPKVRTKLVTEMFQDAVRPAR